MIQSINSSLMQVWLYHSSRSCLSPTVGTLVFLTRFGSPAENEGKKLWIFAETYIGRTRSGHGQCPCPLEGVLKMYEVVPKHQAFIELVCFNSVAKVHTWAALNSTSPCTDRELGSWALVGLSHTSLGTCVPQVGEAQLQNTQPSHGDSYTVQMLWITGVFLDFESNPGVGIENMQLCCTPQLTSENDSPSIIISLRAWLAKSQSFGVCAHHCWGPPLPTETLAASANDVVRLLPVQKQRVSGSIAQLLSTANILFVEPASLKTCII